MAAQDTITGISAMNFLSETAIAGVGSLMCQTLPDSDVRKIKTGMALDYLNVLAKYAGDNGELTAKDINGRDVWAIHTDVFQKNNLNIENWTLDSFFKIVQKGWGAQGVENAWQFIRDTGGDGLDGLAASFGVLDFMLAASFSSDTEVRALADNWLNTVVPLLIPGGDQSKLSNLLSTLLTNNMPNFADILGNVVNNQVIQPSGQWYQNVTDEGFSYWTYLPDQIPDPWAWTSSLFAKTKTPDVKVGPIGPTTIDAATTTTDGGSGNNSGNSNYYYPGFSVDYGYYYDTSVTGTVTIGDSYNYYNNYYSDNYSCYAYDYYGLYGFTGSQSTVAQALGTDIGLIAQQAINDQDFVTAAAANAGHQQAQEAALLAALPNGSGGAVLEAAHWDHQLITWSLAEVQPETAAVFSHALDADYQIEVQQAFATWANASGLKFQQVADSAQSDIRIGFAELDTLNSGVAGYTRFRSLDGAIQSNTLIQLEDPNQLALTTDPSGQKIYADTEAEFSQLLLHEIGHALGLGSNADPYSVMYYELTANNRSLDNTDVAGIKAVYGEGQRAQASVNASVDQLVQALASFAPTVSGQMSLPATNDPFINAPLLAVSR